MTLIRVLLLSCDADRMYGSAVGARWVCIYCTVGLFSTSLYLWLLVAAAIDSPFILPLLPLDAWFSKLRRPDTCPPASLLPFLFLVERRILFLRSRTNIINLTYCA